MSRPEDQFTQGDAHPCALTQVGIDPFTGKPWTTPMQTYITHQKVRFSDSSLYDEVCDDCGARNFTPGEDQLEKFTCEEFKGRTSK